MTIRPAKPRPGGLDPGPAAQSAATPLRAAMRAFDDGAQDFLRANAAVRDVVGRQAAVAAAPALGDWVLDACCGAGASALPLARAVGPAGRVDAVDLSPRLTRHGQRAARRAGLGRIAFHAADVLAWAAARASTYDAAVCTLGLMFLPEPAEALTVLASALRPGGRIAVTTWAAGAMQPLAGILWRARLDCGLAPPPVPPFAAAVAATEEPGRLLNLAARARLDRARVDVHHQKLALPGPVGWALSRGTVLNSLLAGLNPGQEDRVRRLLDEGMTQNGNLVDATTLTLHARRTRPFEHAAAPGRTP